MATRRDLEARCRALGVELVADGHRADLEVLCPAGKRFAGTDVHMYRINTFNNPTWKMSEAYAEMLRDLEGGVETCSDPTCDYCTEEEVTP